MISLYLISFFLFIGGVGQAMFLPLFIRTFINGDSHPGEYFVFFMMSLSFIPIFGIVLLFNAIRGKLGKVYVTKEMIYMGIFDALNGLLVVFCSALNRTNGDLQAILIQSTIPLTLIFSRILYRVKISSYQIIAALTVAIGILVSSIPSFIDLSDSDSSAAKSWYFPFLFFLSTIPGVLMNVVPTGIFKRDKDMNINFILLVESIVQFATCCLLFWADLIPGFGTSSNMTVFKDNLKYGFECFFTPDSIGGECHLAWIMGLAFSLCYCITYWTSLYIVRHSTANYSSLVSAIAPPVQMAIWYGFPKLTKWAGGEEYSKLDIILGMSAMAALILPGSIAYRVLEIRKKRYEEVYIGESDPLLN